MPRRLYVRIAPRPLLSAHVGPSTSFTDRTPARPQHPDRSPRRAPAANAPASQAVLVSSCFQVPSAAHPAKLHGRAGRHKGVARRRARRASARFLRRARPHRPDTLFTTAPPAWIGSILVLSGTHGSDGGRESAYERLGRGRPGAHKVPRQHHLPACRLGDRRGHPARPAGSSSPTPHFPDTYPAALIVLQVPPLLRSRTTVFGHPQMERHAVHVAPARLSPAPDCPSRSVMVTRPPAAAGARWCSAWDTW